MNKAGMDMCHGPILKKIILYTLPIMATGILQHLFNAADLIIVGRFCGSNSVGAVGATSALTALFVNLFIGFSTGTGVAVAHAIGSRDDIQVHRAVHTAFPIAFICGGFVSILGFFISRPMLEIMNTPPEYIALSAVYMKIYFAGMIFNMTYNYGASIMRAAGDTKSPLIFLTLSGVLNVILNVIFVTLFHMDVAGVALATTVSQAVSAILVCTALSKRTDAVRLSFRKLRIHIQPLKKIMLIGIPSGIQSSLFSISNTIIQSAVNSFGEVVASGCAAASSIEGFHYLIINSFNHTALNFTGQNVGARKYDRVKKIMITCFILAIVIGLSSGLLFFAFAKPLLSIYITDSAEAINYGLQRMTVFTLTYFLCGLMEVTTGCIRGFGVSLAPMIITVLGVCGIRITWVNTIFKIPEFHTLTSLYSSFPISWTITFLAQLVVLLMVIRKHMNNRKASV